MKGLILFFNRLCWSDPDSFNAVESQYRQTPIFKAVWSNNPAAVELLLRNGASVEIENKKGQTPLEYAQALNPSSEIIRLLRKHEHR